MKDVGAMGTIFDERRRVLLVHQTYKGSKWAWPGGVVDHGEAPWEAAVREVKEETGLEVVVTRLISVYYVVEPDSIGFQFLCRVVGGELRVDGREISEAAFFNADRLPAPMTRPGRQRVLDALADQPVPILRVFERADLVGGESYD